MPEDDSGLQWSRSTEAQLRREAARLEYKLWFSNQLWAQRDEAIAKLEG